MSIFHVFRQVHGRDCGPTCLLMIFRHHGSNISQGDILRAISLSRRGASLLQLVDAATKLGFNATCHRMSLEQLVMSESWPCVIVWDKFHTVVLTAPPISDCISIVNPTNGRTTYSKQDFLRHWATDVSTVQAKGVVIQIEPAFERQGRNENPAAL